MSRRRAYRPPLLVVTASGSANPFSSYIQEILDIEGFFARDDVDLAVTSLFEAKLDAYETVVLANIDPGEEEQALLRRYVANGGNLIALRPPRAMADVFGLRASEALANIRVKDRYISLFDRHELSTDLPCRSLQFHGDMDLYLPEDADVLAHAAGQLDEPTGFAAVTTRSVGTGRVAAFAYDLSTTVVRLHQGNPANASTGMNPDPDGDDRWAPNDLFVGQLDSRLKFLPQADLHQDLLVRMLNWMSHPGRPAPRVWYFADAAPCVAYFNGDSDGMVRESYDSVLSVVERYGGRFTLYLLEEHHHLIDSTDHQCLRDRGHAFGQHVDLPMQTTVEDARDEVSRSIAQFDDVYGYRPLTNRGHLLVWPGWTDTAEILESCGVRMDQNFIPRRFLQHGYLNGSGLPVKFVREDGVLLDLFEQNTHITDDGSVDPDKFLVGTSNRPEVLGVALRMLEDCAQRFHGVFQAAFHPQLTVTRALWLLEPLLERCREEGIPMVSGDDWVRFNDARRHIHIEEIGYEENTGSFHCHVSSMLAVDGLTIMLPAVIDGARLTTLDVDGSTTSIAIKKLKGTLYALFALNLGNDACAHIEGLYAG